MNSNMRRVGVVAALSREVAIFASDDLRLFIAHDFCIVTTWGGKMSAVQIGADLNGQLANEGKWVAVLGKKRQIWTVLWPEAV